MGQPDSLQKDESDEELTKQESLDIQHLLHFQDMDSPISAHSLTDHRVQEIREKLVRVTGVDFKEKYPELFPDK